MENKLIGGDYVPDGAGGFVRQTGSEALLSQALFRLTCRRGRFPLLPELGSLLYTLDRESRPAAPWRRSSTRSRRWRAWDWKYRGLRWRPERMGPWQWHCTWAREKKTGIWR